MLGSSAIATEALKNLVLPGIAAALRLKHTKAAKVRSSWLPVLAAQA